MIRIIDTFSQIGALFDHGVFNLDKWETYINAIYENSAELFKSDLKEYLDSGKYFYEKDFLPIINAVYGHGELKTLHNSFRKATDRLNERIATCFGNEIDADIILYVGLCNAAGWVTDINGKCVIWLGIEKILELGWQDEDSMYGLIYHELGHVYHMQRGDFYQESEDSAKNFVWQLFTEGVAMYFEQVLVGDANYFHQDKNGWLEWCDGHLEQIALDFCKDLPTMTHSNQKYFGDWARYCGRGDVGYFLGARLIRFLRDRYNFEQLLHMKIDEVYMAFFEFAEMK